MPLSDIPLQEILDPKGRLASLWALIRKGSVELEISQERNIIGVKVSRDTVVINIGDAHRIQEAMRVMMVSKMEKTGEKSVHKRKREKVNINEVIALLQDAADSFDEMGKTFILQYEGKDVLRAGRGAGSFALKLFGYRNMEIVNMVLLMRLAKNFVLG